jgi:hypothetical protein
MEPRLPSGFSHTQASVSYHALVIHRVASIFQGFPTPRQVHYRLLGVPRAFDWASVWYPSSPNTSNVVGMFWRQLAGYSAGDMGYVKPIGIFGLLSSLARSFRESMGGQAGDRYRCGVSWLVLATTRLEVSISGEPLSLALCIIFFNQGGSVVESLNYLFRGIGDHSRVVPLRLIRMAVSNIAYR